MPTLPDEQIESPARPEIRHYAWSALGAAVFGAILPSALVTFRVLRDTDTVNAFTLFFGTMLAFVPVAVVLPLILFKVLSVWACNFSLRQMLRAGAAGGILLAFYNLPGYSASAQLLNGDEYRAARFLLLFCAVGTSNGMWIGWAGVERDFILRRISFRAFRCARCFCLFFYGGGAMLVFQPRQWPEETLSHRGER